MIDLAFAAKVCGQLAYELALLRYNGTTCLDVLLPQMLWWLVEGGGCVDLVYFIFLIWARWKLVELKKLQLSLLGLFLEVLLETEGAIACTKHWLCDDTRLSCIIAIVFIVIQDGVVITQHDVRWVDCASYLCLMNSRLVSELSSSFREQTLLNLKDLWLCTDLIFRLTTTLVVYFFAFKYHRLISISICLRAFSYSARWSVSWLCWYQIILIGH